MIIQLSNTLVIPCLIQRSSQKQITDIPFPIATDHSDLVIIVRAYAELIR